jgi:hypothetical protein
MSLSSLQSAFEAVIILTTRSAMAERMRTFRIHSTLPRQSIWLFAQAAQRQVTSTARTRSFMVTLVLPG